MSLLLAIVEWAHQAWRSRRARRPLLTLDVINALRYYGHQIVQMPDTEAPFHLHGVPRFAVIERPALRKLTQLHVAASIEDMRAPPGNRLESLAGNRAGQWSVRVNDRYRICFVWRDGNAEEVEIVDYH